MIDYFKLSMQVISAVLSLYMAAIFIRLILSWIHSETLVQTKAFLGKITDPYLNLFKGISWLRIGMFDLSPILGIAFLGIMVSLTGTLARQGYINGWQIAIMLISYMWSILRFFLDFLILIFVIRLVSTLIQRLRTTPFFHQMDQMIYSVSERILGLFTSRPVSFQQALIICASLLLVLRIGATIGLAYLFRYLATLGNVPI